MNERTGAKRLIGSLYSWAADKIYEPVVVKTFFPLLGGDLDDALALQARAAVDAADGGPILDMPVGTGHFTVRAARLHNGLVVGCDIAEGMVREARRVSVEAAIDNLAIAQADAHRLPFAAEAFGAVLCTNGLQVMPGLGATLRELRRVLRAEGHLFVSVISLPASALLPRDAARHLPAILRSSRDLAVALEDAGFEIVDVAEQRLASLIEARRA